jgi:hypothetical protein
MKPYILTVAVMLFATCVGCGKICAGEASGEKERIYPMQEPIEKELKGTDSQKERIIVLLPLVFSLTDTGAERDYQKKLLARISKESMLEALPWIEKSLEWGCSYWGPEEMASASKVWIQLKTREMKADEKLKFLAETFRPGYPVRIHAAAGVELAKGGQQAKEQLLLSVRNVRDSFSSDYDVLIAGELVNLFEKGRPLELTAKEAVDLSANDNMFLVYVAQQCLVSLSDKKGVELALKALGSPDAQKYLIKDSMAQGILNCPDGAKFYPEVLKSLNAEAYNLHRERGICMILADMTNPTFTRFVGQIRDDLINELQVVAKRKDVAPPGPCSMEDLQLFEWYYQNRSRAQHLLKEFAKPILDRPSESGAAMRNSRINP